MPRTHRGNQRGIRPGYESEGVTRGKHRLPIAHASAGTFVIGIRILRGKSRSLFDQTSDAFFAQPCDNVRRQCHTPFMLGRLVEDTELHAGFWLFSHSSPF